MLWKIPPEKIDYIYYYPIFIDGLRDPNDKHRSVALTGSYELLELFPEKVKDCLPQFILPLKCKLVLKRCLDGKRPPHRDVGCETAQEDGKD